MISSCCSAEVTGICFVTILMSEASYRPYRTTYDLKDSALSLRRIYDLNCSIRCFDISSIDCRMKYASISLCWLTEGVYRNSLKKVSTFSARFVLYFSVFFLSSMSVRLFLGKEGSFSSYLPFFRFRSSLICCYMSSIDEYLSLKVKLIPLGPTTS